MAPETVHPAVKYGLGVAMVVLGAGVAVLGGYRWRTTMKALHDGGEMPTPVGVFILIAVIVVVALALVVSLIVGGGA